MGEQSSGYALLVKRLGFVLIFYSLCRLLFYFFNLSYFNSATTGEILLSFFFGLRFDLTAIIITNTPVILLHFLPDNIIHKKVTVVLTKSLFVIVNGIMLFLNAIDFGLFQFTGKRATADVFKVISYGNDFINTVPKMVGDFWYVLLILIAFWFLLNRFYPTKPFEKLNLFFNTKFSRSWLGRIVFLLIFTGLYIVGFRGGTQFKPLTIISASKFGPPNIVPLILNTPFTYVKTFSKNELEAKVFMSQDSADILAPTIHLPADSAFRPLNVVLLILESFSKEYIGYYNDGKGYTPFLDSLISVSYDCSQTYANGKRSIEGIPAIIAGIPPLLSEPVITSAYSGNSMTTIASLLKKKNYETIFFHGGTNGTMSFDNFARACGYNTYFGRTEYNNDIDFDKTWGIFDEPFLHRSATELTKISKPFFATIFTLSSHHPYSIPEKYKGVFAEGTMPIHKSIRYADYSLKKFFEFASTQEWYKNTLFVLTADHTATSDQPAYQNRQGMYAVPLVFFMPGDNLKGKSSRTSQHIDILPSIMSYLHYDESYFAFGQNTFDTSKQGFAITYLNQTYQLIENNYTYFTDFQEKDEYYRFKDDTIPGQLAPDSSMMHRKLNAFIQNYNAAMINNKMQVR